MKKLILLFTAAILTGGCSVYSDGSVSGQNDQAAIKAELSRAEKEYGNQ